MSYWKLPTLHVLTNLKKTKIMYDSNSFVLFHSIYILLIKESDSITVLYGCLCVCMCVRVHTHQRSQACWISVKSSDSVCLNVKQDSEKALKRTVTAVIQETKSCH